ncbi:hypothetical protein [Legionella maioricensis]|uniref:WipA-like phosphatase domain-containing protein n=1 Tax=Legionella maioricensis TaxID=2896528 RepID=A0A9X2CZT1_9GAMM|nr:hypothetical protein [Legionella maioricensis]MCL9683965.1 hypothetical protein [Legionella maioricensis]MCL9687990.1 hypothetical protein [Legionella maioricensis]
MYDQKLVCRSISNILSLPAQGYIPPKAGSSFSAGDTHGNAIALVRYLYEAGIININQDQYIELTKIYEIDSLIRDRSALNPKVLQHFRDVLRDGFSHAQVPNDVTLRCFGDMLADRGSNDLLSLLVLLEMRLAFPELRGVILLSNHDKCLLSNFLRGALAPGKKLTMELSPCNSLTRLKWLIDNHIIPYEEVEDMIQRAYLPALKLVDYVRKEDGSIDIMGHAPLTLSAIDKAMQDFLPSNLHKDIYASVDDLTYVLDQLNIIFSEGLMDKNSPMYKALTTPPSGSNPIFNFIWPRLTEIGQEVKVAAYNYRFRHGHDGSPGEVKIHGVTYIGYNSIFGKTTPQQWRQAENAQLTMSYIGGLPEQKIVREEMDEAIDEVFNAEMSPTTIILETDTTVSLPSEELSTSNLSNPLSMSTLDFNPLSNSDLGDSAEVPEQVLMTFKTLATLSLNNYIKNRGSYTQTELGEKIWTGVASARNYVRGFFKASLVDIPQVPKALELKQHINALTVDNLKDNWPIIAQELVEAEQLTQSGEYGTVAKGIAQYFNTDVLADPTLKSSMQNSLSLF